MSTLIIRLAIVFSMIQIGFSNNIDINNFSLKAGDDQVEISWNYEVYDSNYMFIIEKSGDAVIFSTIDTIYATMGYENYMCKDVATVGISYYRIRCTKFTGEEITSEISYIEISPSKQNETFNISGLYPMPFADDLNLTIECSEDIMINIRCHDLDGKLLFEAAKPCVKGCNLFNFNELIDLKSDSYYLTVSDGYLNTKTTRLIKRDNR